MSRPLDPRLLRLVPSARSFVGLVGAVQLAGVVLLVIQAGLVADLVTGFFLDGRSVGASTGRLVALGAVAAGRAVLAAVQEWSATRASHRIRADLRAAVLRSVVRMGPVRVAAQPSGRLATAAGPGLEAVDGYVSRALPALIGSIVVPPVVLLRIGFADWSTAVVLFVLLPLVPVFMALVGLMTRRYTERQYRMLARLAGRFLDLVRGLPTLRIYGQSARQIANVRRATEEYRRQTMLTLRAAFLSGLVLDLLATLSVAIVAVDVGLRLDSGSLHLRTALLVLLLTPELFAPLRALGMQHHAAEEGRAAIDAVFELVDEVADVDGVARARVTAFDGSVALRGVSVRYDGRDDCALDGVSLRVDPGEVVVLEGRSGSGKSTLISLLLGFVPASDGTVAVGVAGGPRDLCDVDTAAWRELTAWVPQRPRLTQATVADEVALGDPSADAAAVEAVLSRCAAPHASTPLGESASAISAGQCRRVALARAVLRAERCIAAGSVPLVLLDEPSEDLDAATESVVLSVVASLAGRATVVVATHSARLASVASRRVRMSGGVIVGDLAQTPVPPDVAEVPRPMIGAHVEAPVTESRVSALRALGLRRSARALVAAAALSGLAGLAALALTGTSIWLICRAAQQPNVQELALAVVGVRTFALARALLRYAERLVAHDAALRALADVRVRVFAALEPLVPFATGELRRGDLLRRFVSDVDGVQEGLVRAVVPAAGAAITASGAVVLASVCAPAAGGVLAVALLVGLVAAPLCSRILSGPGAGAAAITGRRDAASAGLVEGLAELTAFGAAVRAVAEVADADAELDRHTRRTAAAAATGVWLAGSAAAAALPLVLAAGGAAVARGSLGGVSVGVLVACVLVGFEAIAPLPAAFAAWSRLRAGLDRVMDVLVRAPVMADPMVAAHLPAGVTSLRVRALSAAPAPGAADVVTDVDLDVAAGYRVAVVGPSGCGKSTLLSTLLRMTPATAGGVDVERGTSSVSLRQLAAADVPALVAGSLQGDHVFDASIVDNVRVARPHASDADVRDALHRANLTDFVSHLPDGWHTAAGPDGASLSGGQRQRLLLARALLADPDVLVLDEPTAHLDVDTERAVLDDLLRATAGRTVVLSTHRLLEHDDVDSTLVLSADRDASPYPRVVVPAGI